jgi:hypothetical protein
MPSGCRIAQHVATPPYGLDVMLAASGLSELLAQPADKDVNDLKGSGSFIPS